VCGIEARVTVERDRAGIALVSGRSRGDVAFGLGFVHAQERFFQMDLSRRAAAGELAELLGKTYVSADRRARVHQFRARAAQLLTGLSAPERALLDAYAAGVGAGLGALRAPPFEYALLRCTPAAWAPADSLLIAFNLYRLLQDERADQDFNRYLLFEALPRAGAEFLAPEGVLEWDAPLVGPCSPPPRVPGPHVLDFRRTVPRRAADARLGRRYVRGSNAWAVSGKHTASGKAMVANDLHLPFGMPPTFYRAALDVRGDGTACSLSGITLPGFPFLLAGTNGEVAWGFANAATDAVDLIRLDQTGLRPDEYRTAGGVKAFDRERETIRVRGGSDVHLTVTKTVWGPVARKTRDGVRFAQSWLAYGVGAVNLAWPALETAARAEDALNAANRLGVPSLAMIVGDRHGDIGWTLAGPLARRAGGRLPAFSSQLTGAQPETLEPSRYPRLCSPEFSRLWAANARPITDGAVAELLAGGYHVCGARAAQIRDALQRHDRIDEERMLRMQRDDRALFLSRWHALFLAVLRSQKLPRTSRLDGARRALETWNGRAAAESVAYRLLRAFHDAVEQLVFEPFVALVRDAQGQFDLQSVTDQLEGPLWCLVTERPEHLLPPWFSDWDALLGAAATRAAAGLAARAPSRRDAWGAVNRLAMRHPLSAALPVVGRLLDAPRARLDGDLHMPLAQTSHHGPVFRCVISPGDGASAIAQMPGGQAGNPLAPYYLAGHADWLAGRRSPLQPGPARYALTLDPGAVAPA
jgi:penicillin amidase